MSIRIGTNIPSLQAQRRLAEGSQRLSKVFEKLSTGQRINRGSDDAAGLAISSSLNSSVRVLGQAVRNVNDGISMANIAQGALSALKDITQRQRELATQAANGSYTHIQRQSMNAEANQLVREYNRIVSSTSFNGLSIFGEDPAGVRIQAGKGADASLLLSLGQELGRNVGDGTFAALAESYQWGPSPSFEVAEFNSDGVPDLLMPDSGTNIMGLFLGRDDGTFADGTSVELDHWAERIALGDFNGDGKVDIVASSTQSSQTTVLLSKGDGTFQTGPVLSTGLGSFRTADMNSDGKSDVIVNEGGLLGIYAGAQDGSLSRIQSVTAPGVADNFVLTDLNNDGKQDIVTIDTAGGAARLYSFLGGSGCTFGQATESQTGNAFLGMILGDFNADGYQDLAALGDYTGGGTSSQIFLGDGNGGFSAGTAFAGTLDEGATLSDDFNGDGIADLAYWTDASIKLLSGDGRGGFGEPVSIAESYSVQTMRSVDTNSDGRLDLIWNDWGDQIAHVLLGNGGRSCSTPYLNLNNREGALSAMSLLDGTLERIQRELGSIGSVTSRLSVALNTLHSSSENEAAAASRIMDADVADESSSLIKTQILQQAASSVLAQANQAPALALVLLQ